MVSNGWRRISLRNSGGMISYDFEPCCLYKRCRNLIGLPSSAGKACQFRDP